LDNSKYLFEHLDEILDFKEDNKTAIITDIDGTISRIVPTPMEAVVDQDMKDAIKKLIDKFKSPSCEGLVGVVEYGWTNGRRPVTICREGLLMRRPN